jgi:malate dehydrogenase (oxaloacetate-decarboxylating)
MTQITNGEGLSGGPEVAIKGADVLIALSKQGPDTVKKEWIASMADDSIVFVCANPIPEIYPWEAKEAGARIVATGRSDFPNQVNNSLGARIVATGRSDFPNQVNNSLGFPGILRGTLDVMAKTITDEMCVAAAVELAKTAEDNGMHEDYLVPTMDEWAVFPREAAAVGRKAIEQGVARLDLSYDELYKMAEEKIKAARDAFDSLQDNGFIKMPE